MDLDISAKNSRLMRVAMAEYSLHLEVDTLVHSTPVVVLVIEHEH